MIIKHNELVIGSEKPFAKCQFGRESYANVLTDIVQSYADGFVLAINNKWGTGKTTFLKMWQQSLQNQKIQTCYFNAWEHDFDKNPMVALLSELKMIAQGQNGSAFASLSEKGGVLLKSLVPAVVKAIAKRYIDSETITEAIEKAAEGTTEIMNDEIKDYISKKKGLADFKKALKEYVEKISDKKPLVFIIDELDRCRPDYSVEVLEHVKHFFNVEGIVFILAMDKIQLSNSIKGYYGSAEIDAAEYLRRFIDVEYSIPNPTAEQFCRYLYNYFQFGTFFNSDERKKQDILREDGETFIQFAAELFQYHDLSLREQEKIFAHARICLRSFKNNNYNFPSLFIFLIYLRSVDRPFYEKIRRLEFSYQELIDIVYPFFPKSKETFPKLDFSHLEALLLTLYANSFLDLNHTAHLLCKNDANLSEYQLAFKSKFETERTLRLVEKYIRDYDRIKISYLFNKIDLLEALVS